MRYSLTLLTLILLAAGMPAQPHHLPYATDFDSEEARIGWKEYRTGYLSLSHWNNTGPGYTGRGISHDYNVGGKPDQVVQDWYVSPLLVFGAEARMTLKIYSSGFSVPFDDNLVIYFIEGKQNPALGDTIPIGNLSTLDHGVWLDTSVTIPALADSGYIAFKYQTVGAAWTTYVIDNIEISAKTASTGQAPDLQSLARLYPTITTGSARLELNPKTLDGTLLIAMYNSAGRLVRRWPTPDRPLLTIDRDGLPAGTYYIRVTHERLGRSVVKVVFGEG